MRAISIATVVILASAVAAQGGDPASDAVKARAKKIVAAAAAKKTAAPDFGAGRTWLNVSRPLTLAGDLKGKVVLMDFWCYCCVNCMHVMPDLAWLESKYAGKAFAVVGVHSAKFANEKDAGNVRQAVVRYEIRHPVVVDDDFRIWRGFGADGWPHFVLVSPTGDVLWSDGGERPREELDALVGAALDLYADRGGAPGSVLDAKPLPIHLERAREAPGELSYPGKLAVDGPTKRLWISDSNHHRVVETDLDGRFLRAFGDGTPGFVDGPADMAKFHRPQGLAAKAGFLYVADTENHALRRVRLSDGVVETIAGTGKQGYDRRGLWQGPDAYLSSPWDVAFVGDDLFVAMAGLHQIWRYDSKSGRIGPFAGDGTERRLDASGGEALASCAFAQPSGLAVGAEGRTLYVADSESSSVRAIALPSGPVTTLAGANDDPRDLFDFGQKDGIGHAAKFQHPLGVLYDRGRLFVADTYNHAIRTVSTTTGATKSPWGTSGKPGSADAPPDGPSFAEPSGFALLGERLYVADSNDHRVRVIDLLTDKVSTLALHGVPVPMEAAKAGGVGADWPEFADARRETLPATTVKAGKAPVLHVRLHLPEGWHLTEDAPSALRVEGLGPRVDSAVVGDDTAVPLPEIPPEGATLRVRLLYYACGGAAASCRVRSVDLTVAVKPSPDAPPDPTPVLVVEDTFVP